MKIHDLEYFFLRQIRRFRGSVVKSYQKGQISGRKSLRFLAFLVLTVSVLKTNLNSPVSSSSRNESSGTVLSVQLPTATPTPFPKRIEGSPDLGTILAQSALVLDASSSAILYEKESRKQMPPASTVKMMTALVVLETLSLDQEVTVPEECTKIDGSKMGLKAGEKLTVESLLYGLLVASAADSSCALSLQAGLSSVDFVAQMNGKATALGLTQTIYTNASGLDEESGDNLSTAEETLKLAREALKDPTFRKITGTAKITVSSTDGLANHQLTTTNELLSSLPGVMGVKTGFTSRAGGCLIFAYQRDGREIIGVVLGSSERGRFEDTQKIIDWVFQSFAW